MDDVDSRGEELQSDRKEAGSSGATMKGLKRRQFVAHLYKTSAQMRQLLRLAVLLSSLTAMYK